MYVLIVDDDSAFCLMLKTFLQKQGFETDTAFSFAEAAKRMAERSYDVVLTDYRLPERNGMDVLIEAKRRNQRTAVIVMTGYADIRLAVSAIKHGAADYVAKPINPDEILAAMSSALSGSPNQEPAPTPVAFIEGESPQSTEVLRFIDAVAPTNLSVIIQGDSGTGKEYAARRIHDRSRRAERPFVAIDCGALPKELATSELFGHIKGAFTGAIADKQGQFEAANGGTLFLDEAGNLPYEVQVHLLRAIQERRIKRIGGSSEIPVDVRIIAASNEDLLAMVNRGAFREDLFHRLNEFTIRIAPLRERPADLQLFAQRFLTQANAELGKQVRGFEPEVADILARYAWPGNLRELKNIIRRAVLLEQSELIGAGCLPDELKITTAHDRPNAPSDLRQMKERTEYELIVSTLEKVRYNKSRAAALLGIDRKTLYNKMRQYGIEH